MPVNPCKVDFVGEGKNKCNAAALSLDFALALYAKMWYILLYIGNESDVFFSFSMICR
jgi:hypothetical protein